MNIVSYNNNTYYPTETSEILVSKYRSIKDPRVCDVVSLHSILSLIKQGDSYRPHILKARTLGKGSMGYNKIKEEYLPTFRFNFHFRDYAKNENIVTSTGLIYLDVDDAYTVPDNEYIFAKWKSLSGSGYGILVRVEGLSVENYCITYNKLGSIIGIPVDNGARKLTQQTVQSYDPEMYHNENSRIYICEKVSNNNNSIKEKGIVTNDTFTMQSKNTRFDNIDEYFTDETPYIVFENKVKICQPFIPHVTLEGQRNQVMFSILSQYSLLNPTKGNYFLQAICNFINKKMHPELTKTETAKIIRNVLLARNNGSIKLQYNKERRILFNPRISFTRDMIMSIVNMEVGKLKTSKTKNTIYLIIETWDFTQDGKLVQKKVAEKAGISLATVKRYWKEFKDYVKILNNDNSLSH